MFENHFKRHDLGPNFHEINYDGTIQARNNVANASSSTRRSIIAFLNTLILSLG